MDSKSKSSPWVSVIVPVFNEEQVIAACLEQFASTEGIEVLVIDGGSEDGTQSIVRESGLAELIPSASRGRAAQMNAGAAEARGRILLFLHADCVLPGTWESDVRTVLGNEQTAGGRFRLAISEPTLSFWFIAFYSTIRSRYFGITYGDQAIFVRRSIFEAIGGYPDRKIFEDSEFCDAVGRLGRFDMAKSSVISSSRRWRAWGVWRTVFRMWFLRLLYTLSVSDDRLVRMYRNVR